MPTIPPTSFNITFGALDTIEFAQIDGLLPAMAADLARAKKPEQVQAYLEERAGEILDKGPKDKRIERLAAQIQAMAEDVAIDADLFTGMLGLAYGGGTRIQVDEAKALIAIKDWIIDTAKSVDKKPQARKMLKELELVAKKPDSGEGIATKEAQLELDALVAQLEEFIKKADDVSKDRIIDAVEVEKTVDHYDIQIGMRALIEVTARERIGKRGNVDLLEKVAWFRQRIAQDGKERFVPVGYTAVAVPTVPLAEQYPDIRIDLIAKHIDEIEATAKFFTGESLGYSIFEINPGGIPNEDVRNAARAAAKAINEKRAADDGTRLNCFELQSAIAALQDDGDPVTRKELLKAFHEIARVAIHGDHEATAAEAMRSYLGIVDDFMKSDENVLLCAGFTAFEVGQWSPKRKAQLAVATYFPLPNEKGELDYEVKNLEEAEKIHKKYADDLADTELNCVTFEFDKRVWVAVYPSGDLESIEPGRTEIPIFDLERQARGSGKVVGKVDPFTSSAGEAVFRTGSRFIKSFVNKFAGSVTDTEKRGEKLAEAIEKRDSKVVEKFSLLGLIGVGGAAAISPAFLWGLLGLAGAPSAVNLAGFAVTRYQLRPIYELLGNAVIHGKKL